MPRRVSKILQIIGGDLELKSIKDSKLLIEAYAYYLTGKFFLMAKTINKYGEFDFFKDLFVYLKHHYQSEAYKDSIFENVMDQYFQQQDFLRNYLKNN
jgi:hypothetical protein